VQCTGCDRYFGKDMEGEAICPCEKTMPLTQFYPKDSTSEYIQGEGARDDSVFYLKPNGDEIVGFSWGYKYKTPEEFAKGKYKTSFMQNAIKALLNLQGVNGELFYFSEAGVREDFRGQGISSELSEKLLTEARLLGLPVVMRTNCESPMVFVANKLGMEQIMGPNLEIVRDETNNRGILRRIGFVNNLCDTEIEDRILFMLQSD